MQARWLGGDETAQPRRWAAASPARGARHVRTPVLLAYADDGNLTGQGRAWHHALTAAGVDTKLITIPGAGHLFSSHRAQRQLYRALIDWLDSHR